VTANGGAGGGTDNGTVGKGGNGTAAVTLVDNAPGASADVVGSATANGGNSGSKSSGYPGKGGNASAVVNVTGNGAGGSATADASGGFGATPGSASASATVDNATAGAVSATSQVNNGAGWSAEAVASAPVLGPASASSTSSFGLGQAPLVPLAEGQIADVVKLTPTAPTFATGAMSAEGVAGSVETLEATADINFTTTSTEPIYLNLVDYNFSGTSFASLTLEVTASDGFSHNFTCSTLICAENLFNMTDNPLIFASAGAQFVDLTYSYTSGGGDPPGFAFNYNIADTPYFGSGVPEASTWAMMFLGFLGLGWLGYRRARVV